MSRMPKISRRGFLSGSAGLSGLAVLGPAAKGIKPAKAIPGTDRLSRAHQVRVQAAEHARSQGAGSLRTNGDEQRLGRWACHSKGLPHDARGEVDPKAWGILLRALASGRSEDFEQIPLGGFVKLANPQSALAYELIGPDASQMELAVPPSFDSAEQAGEMVELYWHALARDVPFAEYGTHPLIAQAAEDLSRLSAFRGPRKDGHVGGATVFRGATAGDVAGPYLSQFLWKPIPWTPLKVEQKIRTAVPGVDYLTGFDDWLRIQNGAIAGVNQFDAQPRYIRNGRELGEYVHRDLTYQAFPGACLTALKMGTLPDGGNPYKHSRTQSGFTTFGQPYLLYLVAVVAQAALKVCWYQKWMVHRRLRPEELAGRVEARRRGLAE